jgi:hypothetical protein
MSSTTHSPGEVATLLDEILLTGNGQAFADACRQFVPLGWADQVDAAAAELIAAWRAALADLGEGITLAATPYERCAPWAGLGTLETLARWSAGSASTCLHAPTILRPEVVHAAAWRPGLVVCSRCQHLLSLRRGSVADRRCDGCTRVTAGPDYGDTIYAGAILVGPLSWRYGTCADCRWDAAR